MFSACALGARGSHFLSGSAAPLEGRGGVENYVEKWFSRLSFDPARGSAHLSAQRALRCGEAVRAEPPGGQSPDESGGIQTRAKPPLLAGGAKTNAIIQNLLLYPRRGLVIASAHTLPPKAEGAPAIIQKSDFVSPERIVRRAVNCASAPTRRRRGGERSEP